MKVCKSFTFAAAHYLPNYEGKCSKLHGHTWRLDVEVEGEVDKETGMVLDFAELKRIVNEWVIEKLDHTCLNDQDFKNPTCEVMVQWIWIVLSEAITTATAGLVLLSKVSLYESPDSHAEQKELEEV